MSPSTSTRATTPILTFESLSVRPIINCRGTYTILSGSRMLTQVADAMVEASNSYVNMDELMEAVGRRLAKLTGAPWGYVTSGCAAALAQVACACIAGSDPEKMMRLPDTTGLNHEIIMQRAHRNSYDWALRMTGARMLDVSSIAEMRAVLSERTALVAITGDAEEESDFGIPEMIALAREHGVPCLVDAAAQRPDVPNRYLAMGADVVLYSGGKCLRGPQSAGLALGRQDLLQAAFMNGAPHHALGRPMKTGKEEIMGLLAAVEAWLLGRDHAAEWRMWEGYLERIRGAVHDLPSVRTVIEQPGLANHAPTLVITWDSTVLKVTPEMVQQELLEGEPRIAMHLASNGLRVMPYMMERGDDAIVATRLRQLLSDRPELHVAEAQQPAVDVNGSWQITIRFGLGQATHAAQLVQLQGALSGRYCTPFGTTDLQGTVAGDNLSFSVSLGCQSNMVTYRFAGQVNDTTMQGQVELGEFGNAAWCAERVS